ncbi:MAG: SAF domain-containing protein [Mycobacterium sp.]
MGCSLNPSVLNRVSRALRPDFTRTVLARRLAAGLLVVLAGAAALRADPAATLADVVVAAEDLRPGVHLSADHLRLEKRLAATLPDGALRDITAVLGATLAGPARRGEVLTDVRVLGSRLAGLAAGPDARVVPLHLANPALAEVIRAGDVVDVLGSGAAAGRAESTARPRVIAANAMVVSVTARAAPGGADDRIVLVALPAAAATALAAASLVQDVTVTIR